MVREEPAAASPEPETRAAERFIAIDASGAVTAYNGHVDLGTGIATALTQIVAEELDVAPDRVAMVLGRTGEAPNQGATIASETVQVTAVPLRQAAAQARAHLLGLAAKRLDAPIEGLDVEDGIVRRRAAPGEPPANLQVSYGELIAGRRMTLMLDPAIPVKAPDAYRIVGQRMARLDMPAKATGTFTYVHDVRVPAMLHGRVVRPPYVGLDAGDFVGSSLIEIDERSIDDIPGIVAVVVIRDFIGIVAEREENAARAAERLKTRWRVAEGVADLDSPEQALRAHPSTPRILLERGDVDTALAGAAQRMPRSYAWPYQMHGSIGPSCAVADVRPEGITVWSGTQNPYLLRADLARLLDLPEEHISILRHEASGCYGRNCADDVSADAALLSRAVGRPVRVQLTRAQEHAWEPKGAAQVMDVEGGLDAAGHPAAYVFGTRYPSNAAPTLALLLTGAVAPVPQVFEMGDRTAIPPYAYDNARITVHDMAPIVRASWLRGVSALPNSFAHESYIDELATAAGVDPVEYRLRHLDDPRARELITRVAERAGWVDHAGPQTLPDDGERLRGRGFAYATYVHGKFPGTAAASSAWVADVAVDRATGEVEVTRVVVGQDAGLMINPAGVEHQVHGNVIQSTSRVLKERVTFEDGIVTSRDWGTYPILGFAEVPAIDLVMLARPADPPLGVGESTSVPSAAAIANAIFDATGVRFREPPFTPERVRAALNPLPAPASARPRPRPSVAGAARSWGWLAGLAGAAAGALGLAAALLPAPPAIAPILRADADVFSAGTISRGRLAAAVGDCAVCHIGPNGEAFAGGRAIHTPFGIIYATNITPDPETGIGAWSYPAFERAMRQGVSRDGHQLYPAHPYPSFAKADEADLEALYAYLMAQPAVRHVPPATALPGVFGLRPLMAAWNKLFLRPGAFAPDPARSAQWNRGAYLVEGLGHCSACHSPRNVFGAERGGAYHLAGGIAEGWEAPALTALSRAPIAWTEDAFHDYLSTGHAAHHGVAAGPMAPVVSELAALPDEDRRAMAHYLASFQPAASDPAAVEAAVDRLRQRTASPLAAPEEGARIFGGACTVCHAPDGPTMFGVRPELALNTSVHAEHPDNLVRVILDGIMEPAHGALGTMPGFAGTFSDRQMGDLVRYIRARFAPDAPPWDDVEASVARLRAP
ncbi:MAG TPA: molybdopterin cofactor-binding domain-containing protein [Lichenihabitans sp.]|nr:molybdopterin cofactor-binding domain-containing protein [Lichenihabitans sp.]